MARRLSTQPVAMRRTLAAIALAVVVVAGVVTASSASPASSSQADHLRAIETTRLQALVDADTVTARKLTAPDFQLINPAGAPLSRDDFLGGVDAGVIDFLALEPSSPIAVRLSGDSATLRYRTAFDVVVGGTHLTHQAWTTALYERRHGRWQIVWAQTTAIPNNLDLFIESIKPVS
ncbi:MAG TPA: nuclear transport factor 2 family protein [Solirubrobacteraceae bacterium]